MFSVVIPNYNGADYLEKCLTSVSKNKGGLVSEIIVVDNGSTDASRRIAKNFKLIRNKKNEGFAKAVNQGIKAAKSDYVAVLNNDLKIDRNWFSEVAWAIKKYRGKKIGSYFGKVLTWDGKKIESTGLVFWRKGKAFNRGNGEKNGNSKYNQEEFIFGPSASAVVFYKPAVSQVGFFDEDFFAYEEDVDLALRLNAAGWKTLYLPKAISYHLGGGTSRKMGNFRSRMDAKNWWFIVLKNYPLYVLAKYGGEIFVERLRNLSGLLKATPWYRWPIDIVKTYGTFLLKLPKIWRKRNPLALDWEQKSF